jgi:acetyl-CoA carboxylase biotin carboxylase subunit
MNTRLQVEHPVTEMVTALDLVKLQIRIAEGEPLPLEQGDLTLRGHAIECRIYAEDPDNNFFPSPGKIVKYSTPAGPGVRLDDGVYEGWTVPNEYDPMLGKLITYGSDRREALARMKRALREYHAGGIRTNVGLFERILNSPDFANAAIYTRWLDDFLAVPKAQNADQSKEPQDSIRDDAAAIAVALWHQNNGKGAKQNEVPQDGAARSRWKAEGRREQLHGNPRN